MFIFPCMSVCVSVCICVRDVVQLGNNAGTRRDKRGSSVVGFARQKTRGLRTQIA